MSKNDRRGFLKAGAAAAAGAGLARGQSSGPAKKVHYRGARPKGTPLFETLIAFENYPVGKALEERRVGLEVRDVKSVESNNYPLSLIAAPGQELRAIPVRHHV